MSFNPDPTEQTVEVIIFLHLPFFFSDVTVKKADEHKHLGAVIDIRPTFASHIHSAINTARRGISMIRFYPSTSKDKL